MEEQVLCVNCGEVSDHENHGDDEGQHAFVVAEVPVAETEVSSEPVKLPIWEHLQVLTILDDGRETATHYHCAMEDGTTMHVPKEIFI